MKITLNITRTLSLAIPIFFMTVFPGCKKDENAAPTLAISTDSINIAASITSNCTFNVTSNTKWQIVSNQSWLTINPTSGNGNATITVSATANSSSAARKADITVSSDEAGQKQLTANQAFVPAAKPNWLIENNLIKEFSMTYIVQMSVDSEIQPIIEGDELAAFIGNQCRGIATIVSNSNNNSFYLLIFGNQNDTGNLILKYFNKQKTWIFEAKPINNYFSNQLVGSPDEPFRLEFE
jgi:hypothetical protein